MLTPDHDQLMHVLFILGGWGTTIAMFLQTLKIKKYISARTSVLAYMSSFPFAYVCYSLLLGLTLQHAWVAGIVAVGLVANFGPRWLQIV